MNVSVISNRNELQSAAQRFRAHLLQKGETALAYDPGWLFALSDGLGHTPYMLEARDDSGAAVGWLPLGYVHSLLFGRFLVSMPYLNVGGVQTDSPDAAVTLIDSACELADRLKVKFLELRGEREYAHPKLTFTRTEKVHMRLALPETEDELWKSIGCKARNQIRKGEKANLTVQWGDFDQLISDFYEIFAVNMRDLGTPVYSINLFKQIRNAFNRPEDRDSFFDAAALPYSARQSVQFAVVYSPTGEPAAGGMLTFGTPGASGSRLTVEVPSASCKRKFNADCANMFLYWQLLKKSIEYKQTTFDFGRSTVDSPTYKFKAQWGAKPFPSFWQYYLRGTDPDCMRPDKGGYGLAVRVWQKLPVWLTRLIGPGIVKGIP